MSGDSAPEKSGEQGSKVFLVGCPNVGKSALFNALTGSYVTVSNYPGTTVDVSRGTMTVGKHHRLVVVDTPGMYSLRPITAEEAVARDMVLRERPDVIVHVADAKNLERMLPLTFQLIETGIPVVLALNLFDELLSSGMKLDVAHLEHDLGIPVVETVAVRGMGVGSLRARIVELIEDRYRFNGIVRKLSPGVEEALRKASDLIQDEHPVGVRTLASLALQNDPGAMALLSKEKAHAALEKLAKASISNNISYRLTEDRQRLARELVQEHLEVDPAARSGQWREKLSRVMVHPVWGIPILAAVLWFGLYKFVGVFGAGTLVDMIETRLFEEAINPWVDRMFSILLGHGVWFDLFAGEYGVFTLGVRYAVAIVLPIVATFFIAFSVIEDTGYLPRLAMLVDRIFKSIGLSGRAVIPITLGFGCDTMATIVTRTLETRKERVIATLLLSLAIPCSAQLGVLLGLLAGRPRTLALWALTVGGIFMLTGFLAKRLVPGEDAGFFMELPPLRLPNLMNVFTKTYSRMVWYFKEVLPVFMLASALIWFGKLTGIFDVLLRLMSYPVRWAGMPEGATPAFLYGFFRRDFGAAGLFDLAKDGVLDGNSLLVAAVVLTLFVPCVAQFVVMWKERGKAMAIGMAAFIFPFAFLAGALLNGALNALGITL